MTGISAGPMAGQTVLVTGGTGGIGRATATGLAAMGARVGITGRDTARTRAAAAEIAAASGNPAVDPNPNWPTSCSPMSWPAVWTAAA